MATGVPKGEGRRWRWKVVLKMKTRAMRYLISRTRGDVRFRARHDFACHPAPGCSARVLYDVVSKIGFNPSVNNRNFLRCSITGYTRVSCLNRSNIQQQFHSYTSPRLPFDLFAAYKVLLGISQKIVAKKITIENEMFTWAWLLRYLWGSCSFVIYC